MSVPAHLVAAYRAALYEVDVGAATFTFQVERPSADLDRLLAERRAAAAALITAYNPRSRRQSAADNTQAHRALLDAVAGMGREHLPSRGRDPDGRWPAEPGLFIFDLSRAEGLTLLRRFDQYALVWIEPGRSPQLLFAEPPSGEKPREPAAAPG